MRVFSCSKVDMRGAATAGGEWTDLAAQERGMEIIGDVVTEWQKFASDRKTIVFGATIRHCEEMASSSTTAESWLPASPATRRSQNGKCC